MTPRAASVASLAVLWLLCAFGQAAPPSLACPRPPFDTACQATCADRTDCDSPQDEMCCPTACGGMSCQRPVIALRVNNVNSSTTSPPTNGSQAETESAGSTSCNKTESETTDTSSTPLMSSSTPLLSS